jgi:hypothetical protein
MRAFPGSGAEAMTPSQVRRRAFVALLALLAVPRALAQHAGHKAHKPQHGGVVRHGGDLNYEFKAGAGTVDVWVTDEADKPVPTDGSTATVTFVDSGLRQSVKLAPAGGNRLSGAGTFTTKKGVQALLEVAVGGKTIAKVTYTLK